MQMSDTCISNEERISVQHLENHTAGWPNINKSCIVCWSKDELWSSIASRTNVRNVIFIIVQYFRRAKITNSNCISSKQNVFRFDITMANVERMQIRKSFEHLIDYHFYIKGIHTSGAFLYSRIKVFLAIFHHNVKILLSCFICYIAPQYFHHKVVL